MCDFFISKQCIIPCEIEEKSRVMQTSVAKKLARRLNFASFIFGRSLANFFGSISASPAAQCSQIVSIENIECLI
jgi:hypothetical protein